MKRPVKPKPDQKLDKYIEELEDIEVIVCGDWIQCDLCSCGFIYVHCSDILQKCLTHKGTTLHVSFALASYLFKSC